MRQFRTSDLWEPRGAIPGATQRMHAQGKSQRARYHTALGSTRETLACIEVGAAFGYVEMEPGLVDRIRKIIGTLARLVGD